MKQTAVEFLIEQISSSKYFYNLMEEIESRSTTVQPNGILQQAKAMEKEQMNHIVDTNKMVSDKVLFEQATVAMEEHYGYDCETEIDAYFRGAKWMQKQFIKNTEQ